MGKEESLHIICGTDTDNWYRLYGNMRAFKKSTNRPIISFSYNPFEYLYFQTGTLANHISLKLSNKLEWPCYLVLLLPPKCWKYSHIPPHLASSGYITEGCKPAYHRCACSCTFIPSYLLPQTTHRTKLDVSQ